jgi:hypothetical protein
MAPDLIEIRRERRFMPNQRSKNKAHLGGFVELKLHKEIVRMARREGMEANKFGFVQKLIQEAIDRRKKKAHRAKR